MSVQKNKKKLIEKENWSFKNCCIEMRLSMNALRRCLTKAWSAFAPCACIARCIGLRSKSRLEYKISAQTLENRWTFQVHFNMFFPTEHKRVVLGAACPLQRHETNSTLAKDLVRRYHACLPIPPDDVPRHDSLRGQDSQPHISSASPIDTLECESFAASCPAVNRISSPSCEALFSCAVCNLHPTTRTLLIRMLQYHSIKKLCR